MTVGNDEFLDQRLSVEPQSPPTSPFRAAAVVTAAVIFVEPGPNHALHTSHEFNPHQGTHSAPACQGGE